MKCYSPNIYYSKMWITLFFTLFLVANTFDPSNDIINNHYYGEWVSPTTPFNYFDQITGNVEILFENSLILYTAPVVNAVEVTMMNPIYRSAKIIRFKLFVDKYQSEDQQWSGNQETKFQMISQGIKEQEVACNVSFRIQMLYTNVRTQSEYKFVLTVDTIQSLYSSCRFNMVAQTKPFQNQEKVFYYCIFIASLSGISLVALLAFQKKHNDDPRVLGMLSIKCVTLTLTQLWYLTIVHMWMLVLQASNYGFFMIPIFFIAVQAAVTLRLLVSIFKVKYETNLNPKKWLLFVISLIAIFFGYFVLMYIYPYDMLTVLLQSFIAVLQIVKNSKHYKPVKISWHYFCGIFFLQFVLGLYCRACPSNIYSIEPSMSFIFFWNGIYIVEFIILLMQRNIGGRFFVPQCIHRHQTGYSLMKQSKNQDQCGICIGNFCINQQFALTKCGHSYHQMCLKEWLKVNERCPMCRAEIQQN